VPEVGTWEIDPAHASFEFVFFGVEDHPTIGFSSTAVRPGQGESEWKVDRELTIRGVTRPITVAVAFLGAGLDPELPPVAVATPNARDRVSGLQIIRCVVY
jgi:polyisoprenoid-binding protein YceI